MRTCSLSPTSFLRKTAGTQKSQGFKLLLPEALKLSKISWAMSPGTSLWTHWVWIIKMRPVCSEECCKCSKNIMSVLKLLMESGMKCSGLTPRRATWYTESSSKIYTGSSISEWRSKTRNMSTSTWSSTHHSKKLRSRLRKPTPTVTPISQTKRPTNHSLKRPKWYLIWTSSQR